MRFFLIRLSPGQWTDRIPRRHSGWPPVPATHEAPRRVDSVLAVAVAHSARGSFRYGGLCCPRRSSLSGRGRPQTNSGSPLPPPVLPSEVDRRRCAFPLVSSRTGHTNFPRTPLSSDHYQVGLVARPAWMSSWQQRHITRVLRRRMAMRCIQRGLCRRPDLWRSASLRMWWTSRFTMSSQISQRLAKSR